MVLVGLRVFSVERSTAGAFAIPFRVLSQKILWEIMCCFRISTLQSR